MRLTSPKRDARYRQLLQAAVKIFARDGIDAASVADIAEAGGVAKGSVYLYFDSKETLSGDVVGFVFATPDAGEALLSKDPNPLHRIVRFCAGLQERVLGLGENAAVVLHMFGHTGKTQDDQLARGIRQLMSESRYLIELLLANAQQRQQLPQDLRISRAAASLLAVTFGVIHSRLAHGLSGPDHGINVARSVTVYLRGLGANLPLED